MPPVIPVAEDEAPMSVSKFTNLVNACPISRSRTLADYFGRYLAYPVYDLNNFSGRFTEVVIAKACAIFRKRGLVESEKSMICDQWNELIKAIQNSKRIS